MKLRDLLPGRRATAPAAVAGEGSTLFVTKVDDAVPFVDALFRATFGDPTPTIPTHYVAFARDPSGRLDAVGYYHVSYAGEYALVGGLCVAPALRGRGIGELLERYVYRDAGDTKAYFAHVGDPRRAERVGFVATEHPHLVVCWMQRLPDEEQRRLIARVAALGAF